MENIIETLYINLNRPQVQYDLELEKAKEEYRKMCDLIKAQYGPDFLDRLAFLRNRIDGRNREEEFSFGFRSCARPMLEALEDQPSIAASSGPFSRSPDTRMEWP